MTNSSSKVIKIKKPVTQVQPVTDKLLTYLQDEELNKIVSDRIERAKKQAYQEGYQKGTKDATAQQEKKFASATQMIDNVVNEFNTYIDAVHRELEQDMIRLVIEMAQAVIKKELSRTDVVSQIIVDALEKCNQKHNIVLHVHPESGHNFEQIVARMQQRNFDLSQIRIEVNPSVGQGGCYIESDSEVVDARIDQILAEVRQKIEELVTWESPDQVAQ
ncbi:MAG: FliH/SctL family protein [Candidatus Auribacterota bacterium]|jgi:flagellar assembly protein FliH|nr:FliH/SctL family protein [Candidatus Auribacterota bacterium]